jgi:hypothetical protein
MNAIDGFDESEVSCWLPVEGSSEPASVKCCRFFDDDVGEMFWPPVNEM